ncbi:MAG: hypothetical protein WB611_13005 [Stellaceae bacterium]
MRAWTLTTIAAALLLAALAVAPMWDGAIFVKALRDALGRDPQLMQPIEEISADEQGEPKVRRTAAAASKRSTASTGSPGA